MQPSEPELLHFLIREKLATATARLQPLHGDGSDRRFFLVRREGKSDLLAVLPSPSLPKAMAEARASFLIGSHLHARGVPVPEIFAFDEQTGAVVFEYLGDLLLHGYVLAHGPGAILPHYRQAIEALVKLQVRGGEGFDPGFCWDTPRYDQQLMLDRESGYFREAFCSDYLGMAGLPAELDTEFARLAARAAQEPSGFLLHRDFQSRNLMIHQDRIRIIDFQGSRFGPLGYDLASLLLDPYAGLAPELQQNLLDYYLAVLARELPVDEQAFREGYYYLRLQRNLQIIGAYAFLSGRRGKPFFKPYLYPALRALRIHLDVPAGAAFPCLRGLASECLLRLAERQRTAQ